MAVWRSVARGSSFPPTLDELERLFLLKMPSLRSLLPQFYNNPSIPSEDLETHKKATLKDIAKHCELVLDSTRR